MQTASHKPVVLVTAADLAPQALEMLAPFDVVFAGKQPTESDIVALCTQHKPVAIIVRYGKINARIMDAAENLQVISKHGSGIDVIDQDAAAARGIAVRAAVGANAAAVAEHAWALMLACAKSVPQLDSRMRAGHWDKATHKSVELDGRTLGLVGLGAIGRRVAAIGAAFGMKVLAFDPFAKEAPAGVKLVPLDTLYAESDVVSLHCPLTADNRRMLNRDALARFKRGAILVNTARGGLIDEAALADALASGHLRAAGLDSFDVEPMTSPHPFQQIPNVILSPHVGGVSDAAYVNMGKGAAANVLAVLNERAHSAA
ncbi:3-phosphoglycerate dehydrogenase [Burkholderia multivorans]|uniref:NAD(P)-dependent oxidoreductase n=1 Tax=Burkholderia multivorans TaxID=87883 RepID=UPI000277CB96|nr:NAD(P)-dependent oxidoreductase [Burkholderia multivorans]AJY15765.1 D-isomer specific 2-hydroxyacid dehydrogenase, NAD binding domain protein [Burkholderia multivorans ATCC BAA-247]AVR18744.1 3-phosphoglycerate dehydrogenase [Burkholderia multivorans]EJO62479.1 4-phosphoerythronate dehydrogenase [Burkholderia multivorans ATCC BAA-247]MBU9496422.1 3-phosphoglycerate dehydrogenase [Burkholderia multivorans]MCO1438197.1 3-phosphoglycerate dehydrogenase [Burkholderia multivorans]